MSDIKNSSLIKVNYDPFREGVIETLVETSAAQKEIWTSIKFEADATLCYNESIEIKLNGIVNPTILEYALNEVVNRHQVLKSNFSADGKYIITTSLKRKIFKFIDYSSHFNGLELIEKFKNDLQKTTHKIETDSLFYGTLFKISPDNYTLILYAHHIVCDGWSYAIILNELSEIYSNLVSGKSAILDEAFTLSKYIETIEKDQALHQKSFSYWEKRLDNLKNKATLPTDFERNKARTFHSKRIDLALSESSVSKFKKLCAKNGVSLYTGLITIYSILVNKLSSNEEMVIGLSSATQPALSNNLLVGHFVNLLPYRLKIHRNLSFVENLKSNRGPMLDAFENQFITFGELVSKLKIERRPGEIPLIPYVFNIDQQNKDQGINFVNAKASYKSIPRVYENFEIFINAVSRENFLELECQFNHNLFTEETIKNWLSHFEIILESVVENPNISLDAIKLSSLYIPISNTTATSSLNFSILDQVIFEKMRSVWKEILLIDQVEENDSFFKLGGHSLLAIEMMNVLSNENIHISMKDIFDHPTLVELANFVKTSQLNSREKLLLDQPKNLLEASLTNSQLQIWYLEELNKKTQMHNLPSAILLEEVVDHNRLKKVMNLLLERHEALRTIIVNQKGRPIQKVLGHREVIDQFKVDFLKCGKMEEVVLDLKKESDFVFEKSVFPLFKMKLYHIGKNQSVIYFMVHHYIWDGWSFDIFFDELNKLYIDLKCNLVPVEYSYLDYADWLDKSIKNHKFNDSIEFWKKNLSGDLPILNLPISFSRPKELSHVGRSVEFSIDNNKIKELKELAGRCNTSLFNIFMTVFKISLLKYSKEEGDKESIVVGMPVRSREFQELLATIGYFVNTVAIKSEIDFSKSFLDNLKNVTQNLSNAFLHQQIPFQVVLNELDYDKKNGRNPIFQTFFSYQDVSNRDALFNNKKYQQVNIDKSSVHTELDLWIKSSVNKTEGAFEFEVSLFNRSQIELIKDTFLDILDKIVLNSEKVLLKQLTLDKNHQKTLLGDFNLTKSAIDHKTFVELFDEQCLIHPNKIAVEDENEKLTYQELKIKSEKLASLLVEEKSELVGISLNRSSRMLVGLLGILKSNKGYVPIDPNFPEDRIEYMIGHSKIGLILTESQLSNRFSSNLKTISLDQINFDQIAQKALAKIENEKTAYVIYTSGSTGLPKGVELSHLSVSNFLQGMKKMDFCKEQDTLLAVTTLSFDIAVLELYLPLITGARVFIAKATDVMDGNKLKSIINNQKITVFQATPTTFRLLLQSGFDAKLDLTVLCGGESFPIDLASKLVPKVKKVLNMYGPTETTVWSSVKELNLDDPFITIGKPIINTTFYILDEDLKLVPVGGVGQLFIGGLGLAKGYLNRPDLTNERFIKNPYGDGELIYATGDLARFLTNGEVICLGRNDGQVKVRGFRIELGEIENFLQKVSKVKECVSIVFDFGNGDKRIIAYYSTVDLNSINESDLKNELIKNLPAYMIPSIFIHLEAIPKTPNGKIDKKALPKDRLKKGVEPSNKQQVNKKLEKNESSFASDMQNSKGEYLALIEIFKNLLKLEQINGSDNFFDLGGNSILAVELMSQINERFGIEIQLSLLLEAKDIKEFYDSLFTKQTSESSDLKHLLRSLVTIKNSGHKNPVFCFHGVGGNVLNYISLVPALNQERPLHAFQSIGLDGETDPLRTIEEMALNYYRELKLFKPNGPYILVGGSMGGLVAVEVARRLIESGDIVEKLIMFDTFGPNFDLEKYSSNRKLSFFTRVCLSLTYRSKIFFNLLIVKTKRALGQKVPLRPLLVEIEHRNYQAIWTYKSKPISTNMILIRANLEESGWYKDPNLGWEGVISGKIEKHFINSDHNNFVESPELVKVLKKILK